MMPSMVDEVGYRNSQNLTQKTEFPYTVYQNGTISHRETGYGKISLFFAINNTAYHDFECDNQQHVCSHNRRAQLHMTLDQQFKTIKYDLQLDTLPSVTPNNAQRGQITQSPETMEGVNGTFVEI